MYFRNREVYREVIKVIPKKCCANNSVFGLYQPIEAIPKRCCAENSVFGLYQPITTTLEEDTGRISDLPFSACVLF